jgi:hypothetical protein
VADPMIEADWVNIKFNDEQLMEVWPQYRAFPLDESAPQ